MFSLNARWKEIRTSFWFLPAVMLIASILLSFLLTWVDQNYFEQINRSASWVFQGSPSAARGLLSTIAGSIITVVSIAFSITVIALQQAATLYSSRILRNFATDSGYQMILGTYIGTFAYSLLVLRTVRNVDEGGDGGFVPALSTAVAIILALTCLALLVYFIYRITDSIQATNIVKKIHTSFMGHVDKLYPEMIGKSYVESPAAAEVVGKMKKSPTTFVVRMDKAGFVQQINEDDLHGVNLRAKWIYIKPKVGDFIIRDEIVAEIDGLVGEEDPSDEVRKIFTLSQHRTPYQDPLFAVRQLVDVALKALSPGINSSTTAEYCLNYLKDILSILGKREFPEVKRTLEDSEIVFIFTRATWKDFVDLAFEQIVQEAEDDVYMTRKIVKVCDDLLSQSIPEERKENLRLWRAKAQSSLLKV